jgi:hypothetical protein
MKSFFQERGDLTLYSYFEAFINILSQMCIDRNNKGILLLENQYNIDFTLDCFFNQNIPYILRSNFARLLIALHLDKEPMEQLVLPNLTRVWHEISTAKTSLSQSKA